MDPAIVLFGLGVGVLVGTTGMGGGSLMTPLLILVFGIKPVVAVGTDLSYAAVTKTVGGWRHWRAGTVDGRLAFWLAVGSCPAALAGVYVLNGLRDVYGDGFDDFLIISIAGAILLTGALVLLRALVLTGSGERAELELQTCHKVGVDVPAAVLVGVPVLLIIGCAATLRLRHPEVKPA
jgi:uncharacterized protein